MHQMTEPQEQNFRPVLLRFGMASSAAIDSRPCRARRSRRPCATAIPTIIGFGKSKYRAPGERT